MGTSGSVCLDWAVDGAPTDLQNGPINGGVVITPLPRKPLSRRATLKKRLKGKV